MTDATTARKRILIIEDDADMRAGLNLRLRANDFETAYAADGVLAMSTALKTRPDLILLDLGLPGGDGFQVLERLRMNAHVGHVPVIVLTARDPEAAMARALQAGAAAFLQKPVEADELLETIRKFI